MQNPDYEHKPDLLEKKIRFGCGFLFGLVIGFFEFARILYSTDSAGFLILMTVLLALVCGWLATKFGDRFWQYVLERVRWWI